MCNTTDPSPAGFRWERREAISVKLNVKLPYNQNILSSVDIEKNEKA